MNTRAFFAAITVFLAGVVLLAVYMRRYREQAVGGAEVEVIVALKNIPLGELLERDALGVSKIPLRYVQDRHIRASDADRVLGARLSVGLRSQEALLWTDLATASDRPRYLSSLIRDGMRAVTVRATRTSMFGGLLRPGDRVDVLVTGQRDARPELRDVTRTLLQSVLVLAVGQDTGGDRSARIGSGAGHYNEITLSVRVEQAMLLTQAQYTGELTLVLRNAEDLTIIEGLPEKTVADVLERTASIR
ncbi:MAG: Flp pilus assembly protein CpaB [Myxococcota bacterium]